MENINLSTTPVIPNRSPEDVFIILVDNQNLLYDSKKQTPLISAELLPSNISLQNALYIASHNSTNVFLISLPDKKVTHLTTIHMRNLLELVTHPIKTLLFRACHITHWNRSTKFCGYCGCRNQMSVSEFAKKCASCDALIYPHYSPSVIVRVCHADKILLGRSPNFEPGVYSTLAGFIEAGETCEEAVHRELWEEVKIRVTNVRFFGSQPWPFPQSLMIGYTADYCGGDIEVNHDELEDANWFTVKTLPKLPTKASIAYHLIDDFIQRQS